MDSQRYTTYAAFPSLRRSTSESRNRIGVKNEYRMLHYEFQSTDATMWVRA